MTLTQRLVRSKTLAALTWPHGVDRYLEILNPMMAATEVRARVVSIRRETTGEHPVATVTLQPTETWRGHRAGQYVQLGVELPDSARRLTRCFSISSAASAPGEAFTVTVRAQADGIVSPFLVYDAQPGQLVHLSQAEGSFTPTESPATPSNNRTLMISGGSGITPVMSHLRTLLRDGYDGRANRRVTFMHYARSRADQIFADELDELAAADNDVDILLRYGDPRFCADELAAVLPSYAETDTWACGPAGLIDLVQTAYADSNRLRVEFFKPPATASENASGDVSFTSSGPRVANTGASILAQAEAAGLTPEFGCRMGICFTCVSRKTEGTVRNILTGEESSLPDEDIRICISAPTGDCAVEL